MTDGYVAEILRYAQNDCVKSAQNDISLRMTKCGKASLRREVARLAVTEGVPSKIKLNFSDSIKARAYLILIPDRK